MAMLCLLMDVGRPDRFWHGFVYWNVHSVLWEVTMCVGLYFSVLILETMPIIAGMDWMQRNLPWLTKRMAHIHHFSPILAIFAAPIIVGSDVWRDSGQTNLVPAQFIGFIYLFGGSRRHFADAGGVDASCPSDAPR